MISPHFDPFEARAVSVRAPENYHQPRVSLLTGTHANRACSHLAFATATCGRLSCRRRDRFHAGFGQGLAQHRQLLPRLRDSIPTPSPPPPCLGLEKLWLFWGVVSKCWAELGPMGGSISPSRFGVKCCPDVLNVPLQLGSWHPLSQPDQAPFLHSLFPCHLAAAPSGGLGLGVWPSPLSHSLPAGPQALSSRLDSHFQTLT